MAYFNFPCLKLTTKIPKQKAKRQSMYLRRTSKFQELIADSLCTDPLPPGAPHLAILEPYCNQHITFEAGNTSDSESNERDCGFQESIKIDVENSDASGILVTEADTCHSGTFVETDSLSITTTLNEEEIKEVENDIMKERTVCEEEEPEKCIIIKEVISCPEFNDPSSSDVTYIDLKIPEEPNEDEKNGKQMQIEEDENEIKLEEMGHEVSLCEDQGKEKEMEEHINDEVEVSYKKHGSILIYELVTNDSTMTLQLLCLSVRIGNFKIYPTSPHNTLNVSLSKTGLSFYSPMLTDDSKRIKVTIRPCDVFQMLGHFGKCVPILFIITTSLFAEALRNSLNMHEPGLPVYDPISNNPKMNKITFLLDDNTLTNEQCELLRQSFMLKEIDKQTANELLVKSTP